MEQQQQQLINQIATAIAGLINNNNTFDYESERRNRIIKKLIKQILSKRISLELISEWAEKTPEYIIKNLPQRSRYTKTFLAVDVVKFLCDLWDMPYPQEYFETCDKFKISA